MCLIEYPELMYQLIRVMLCNAHETQQRHVYFGTWIVFSETFR